MLTKIIKDIHMLIIYVNIFKKKKLCTGEFSHNKQAINTVDK